jgi:hypothetical protein
MLDDLQVGGLRTTSNIIGLPGTTLPQDHPDGFTVVLNEQPVTYLAAVPINWKRFSIQGVENHEGDEFFGELCRP